MAVDRIQNLWRAYRRERSMQAKEELIQRYAYLVKYVLGRMHVLLPSMIDQDDLTSSGIMGLLQAIERYDETKRVKFETFAIWRIRGNILDQIRAAAQASRTNRQRMEQMRVKYRAMESTLGRPPTDEELADALGMDIAEFYRMVDEGSLQRLLSLDSLYETDGGGTLADVVREPAENADHEERVELRMAVADAVSRLGPQERMVVRLYYYEGLTLKEIACVMKVTESRVCQVHRRAIVALQSYLTANATTSDAAQIPS